MAGLKIDSTESRAHFTVTTSTTGPFVINFGNLGKSELEVYVGENTKLADAAWNFTPVTTQSGNPLDFGSAGGSISLVTPVANTTVTVVGRQRTRVDTDFASHADFSFPALNASIARLTLMVRDYKEQVSRLPQYPEGDQLSTPQYFPAKSARAEHVPYWDANGLIQVGPLKVDVETVASIADEIAALAEPSIVSGIIALSPAEVIAGILAIDSLPTEIEALGGVVTEIAALGDAAVIADMALLGDANVIADMSTNADNVGKITTVADDLQLGAASLIAVVGDDLLLGASSFILRAPGFAAEVAAWSNAAVDTPVEGVTGDKFTFNPATDVNLTTNVITKTAHGLSNNQPVTYRHGGGTALGGLTTNTQYWVEYVDANSFKLTASRFGSTVDLTTIGTGTAHEIYSLRSSKHNAFYALIDRLAAEAASIEAIEAAANAAQLIKPGTYANASAVVAAFPSDPAPYIYKRSTGELYVLSVVSPPTDVLFQPAPAFASQGQAEAGTDTATMMNPLRTAQAIAALSPGALNEDNFATKSTTRAPSQLSTINYIYGSKHRPARDFGILQNTENMTPWETMVSAINAGDVNVVDFHPGLYVLDDATALSAITGSGTGSIEDFIALRGVPAATRFQVAAGAGTVGTIFKLGASPNFLRRFFIDGFDISFLNTPDAAQPVFDLPLARDAIISRINGRGWGKALKTTQAGLIFIDQWNIEAGAQAGAADSWFDFNNAAVIRMHRVEYNGSLPGNLDADGCMVSVQSGASGANIDTFEMLACEMQMFSKTGSAADGRPVGVRIRKPSGDTGSLTNVWIRNNVFDHTTVAAVDMLVDAASTNSNSRILEITGNRFATDSGKGVTIDNQSTDLVGNAYCGLSVNDNTIIVQTNNPAIEIKGTLWNSGEVLRNKIRDRFGLTADRFNDMIDHAIAVASPNINIDLNTVCSDDGVGYVRNFDGSSASVVSTANDTLTLSSVTTFNPATAVSAANDTITLSGSVFQNNQKLRYRHGGGGAIGGLTTDTDYYVRDWSYDGANSTFKLAASEGGAAINLTSTGSGSAHELIVGHGYDSGMQLEYSAGGGTVITGLTEGQIYIPRDITADTLKLNEGGAAAIDLTALGVGSSHNLKLKTRFRAFVKATGAGVSNLQIGPGNRVDCLTYFDEATYPTIPYGNNRILNPRILHENDHREWQMRREFFDEIASGTATQPNSRFWNTAKGSDGTTVLPYIDAAAERGLLTFDVKNTATKTMAVNGVQMVGPLVYRSQRGLVIEADVTHNDVNDAALFFGFTDQNSALEMPMEHNGSSVIATATDAVGWLYDTNFSTDNWRCVAAANGVVRNFDSGRLHVNSVYQILRIELDYRGNADFFLNGVYVGHITTAVTPSVALAPYWGGYSRNGGYFARMDRFKIAVRADKPA